MLRTLALLGVVGFLVLFGSVCHRAGRKAEEARNAERVAEAVTAALTRQTKAAQVAADVGAQHEQVRTEIRWRTRVVQQLVPQLVTPADDSACRINNGFVRAYDAAASGTVPDPPSVTDGEPSDVRLSEVAEVSVENLGRCSELRATVLGWQSWYSQVAAVYGK